ncbi:tRNA pseudouridine(55) synthase TruB [Idiomarina seosinensis]|uniref:tRNA pseudouridine(55) synthase TruB n=1 Tax=Idiomarina seosinensis TaxID=281739 RepID=UPI00384E485D
MAKARPRKGRPINGVVLLNKPEGMSSNHALQRVKRLYNAQKAGHTGALDPLATGLLPICLGEATKFSQYLLDADKAYRVHALLGVRTSTSDSEGEVVATAEVGVNEMQVRSEVQRFIGTQQQSPSIYSALKHEGRPLYYYARKGIEVPRKTRTITFYEIEFISLQNNVLELQVSCSKGTYIRTLIDDLGQALGCGAHVIRLHRNSVAGLDSRQMLNLEQLEALQQENALDDVLQSVDCLLQALPVQQISAAEARDMLHGQAITNRCDSVFEVGQQCRMECLRQDGQQQFIGIGILKDDGLFWPKRVVALQYAGFTLAELI